VDGVVVTQLLCGDVAVGARRHGDIDLASRRRGHWRHHGRRWHDRIAPGFGLAIRARRWRRARPVTLPLPPACLMLVTSRHRLAPDARTARDEWLALDAFLDAALDARVDAIQIREPDADSRSLDACVEALMRRASPVGVRVLVNDRVDVAHAAGADGVHLPGHGLPGARVRHLMPGALVGRSIHGEDVTDSAQADYLLFGTVFATESKPGQKAAGLDALARAVARNARPVLAIGGVTPARVAACVDAGASGVAAIGAFLPPGRSADAMGMGPAVRAFREALSRIC
jgi:thiamine-phosphate diphosphorylase